LGAIFGPPTGWKIDGANFLREGGAKKVFLFFANAQKNCDLLESKPMFAADGPMAFDRIAVDAGRLMIFRIPEQRIVFRFRRNDMVDALGDDGAAGIQSQGTELMAGLFQVGPGIPRPSRIVSALPCRAAPQVAGFVLFFPDCAMLFAVSGKMRGQRRTAGEAAKALVANAHG
jgi:hypothetical protein